MAIEFLSVLGVHLVGDHLVVVVDFDDAVTALGTPAAPDVAVEKVAPLAGHIDAGLQVIVTVEHGADIGRGFEKFHDRFTLGLLGLVVQAVLGPAFDLMGALWDVDHHEDGRCVFVGLQLSLEPVDVGGEIDIRFRRRGSIRQNECEVADPEAVICGMAPNLLPGPGGRTGRGVEVIVVALGGEIRDFQLRKVLVAQLHQHGRGIIGEITIEKERVQPPALLFLVNPFDHFAGHLVERRVNLAVVQVRGRSYTQLELASGSHVLRAHPAGRQGSCRNCGSGGFQEMTAGIPGNAHEIEYAAFSGILQPTIRLAANQAPRRHPGRKAARCSEAKRTAALTV